jgi:hypothetical protein
MKTSRMKIHRCKFSKEFTGVAAWLPSSLKYVQKESGSAVERVASLRASVCVAGAEQNHSPQATDLRAVLVSDGVAGLFQCFNESSHGLGVVSGKA